MLQYIDLLLLLVSSVTCFYGSFVIGKMAFNSPTPNLYYLLSGSIFSLGLNFFLIIPIFLSEFSIVLATFKMTLTPTQSVLFLRISHLFAIFFVLTFTLLFYLPSLTLNIKPIVIIICVTVVSTTTAIIDVQSMNYFIEGNKIIITYIPLGQILLIFTLSVMCLMVFVRYREIQTHLKLKKQTDNPLAGLRAKKTFYLLIILIVLSFVLRRSFAFLPSYLWAGFTEIGLLFLINSFRLEKSFLFISNSKLEGVIVLNSLSGKIQFYRNFHKIDMLITGVMTAFNISIKNLVASETDIQQVTFKDKVLHFSKGKFTTTIVLVSEKSVISESISKFLSKRFEERFKVILNEKKYGVDDINEFQSFNVDVDRIVKYFIA